MIQCRMCILLYEYIIFLTSQLAKTSDFDSNTSIDLVKINMHVSFAKRVKFGDQKCCFENGKAKSQFVNLFFFLGNLFSVCKC